MYSCECVPNIVTPRVVTPSQNAHILFVNCLSDWNDVKINTGYQPNLEDAYYNDTILSYQDIIPALTNIYMQVPPDSLIYNGLVEIQEKLPYTFIAYGTTDRIQGMLINDSIDNYDNSNAYIRYIHTGNDVPVVIFKDQYNLPVQASFRTATKFNAVVSRAYTIEVHDAISDSIYISKYKQLEKGHAYTIILRGYLNATDKEKLNIYIVDSDYWLTKSN